jgi:hypothetical protein
LLHFRAMALNVPVPLAVGRFKRSTKKKPTKKTNKKA